MNADGAVFSTEAVSPISNVNVWPNPAKSEFQVQFDLKTASELTLLLSDLNGEWSWNNPWAAKQQAQYGEFER